MLSLEANVSALLIWQVCVIFYATLTWSGSRSLVKALLIGYSLSGNSRKSDPFCQILSEFRSFGFLPRVSQSAMLFLLSVQYQSSGLVFCCISPTRVAAKVLNPYDSFWITLCTIWESTLCLYSWSLYLQCRSRNAFSLEFNTAPQSSILSDW